MGGHISHSNDIFFTTVFSGNERRTGVIAISFRHLSHLIRPRSRELRGQHH